MRILLVTSRFPFPPRRGNQRRTVEWARALANHELTVLCPAPAARDAADEPLPGTVRLRTWPRHAVAVLPALVRAVLSGRPLQEGLYDSPRARRSVGECLAAGRWDLVVVQMVRMAWVAELVRRHAPGVPVLVDLVDSMAFHVATAQADFPAFLRPLLRMESRRCRRREVELAAGAALTVAVAERELRFLGLEGEGYAVVPVAGRPPAARCDRANRPTILLSGNLGYRPTVRAAQWFAAEVWPRVKRELPELRWLLVGARPTRSVRRLGRLDGVELVADPPEMWRYLGTAWVAIAPMATGSGVPMKVLEAWAAELPVIAHPHTAAGLAGGGGDALVVVEDADAWCHALLELLNDDQARAELAARGTRCWAAGYAPERVAEELRRVVDRAVS